jgi:hypothetical protein
MAKEKKFDFAPLPSFTIKQEEPQSSQDIILTDDQQGITKVTFDCPNTVLEQMKDYGYWEGLTQKDIILEALNVYFQDRNIRSRPDKVKARPKVGRKPKQK